MSSTLTLTVKQLLEMSLAMPSDLLVLERPKNQNPSNLRTGLVCIIKLMLNKYFSNYLSSKFKNSQEKKTCLTFESSVSFRPTVSFGSSVMAQILAFKQENSFRSKAKILVGKYFTYKLENGRF